MGEAINILLVEDDRNIALALQIRLKAAGYSVQSAVTLADARSLIEKKVPDIALLDVNLPDGDGISLMKSFAMLGLNVPIDSIVMSASRSPGLREDALTAGAIAFLEKPFSSSLLLETLASNQSLKPTGT